MEHIFDTGVLPWLQPPVALDLMSSMWRVVGTQRLVRGDRRAPLADHGRAVAIVGTRCDHCGYHLEVRSAGSVHSVSRNDAIVGDGMGWLTATARDGGLGLKLIRRIVNGRRG